MARMKEALELVNVVRCVSSLRKDGVDHETAGAALHDELFFCAD
jgi:hypothetical protein